MEISPLIFETECLNVNVDFGSETASFSDLLHDTVYNNVGSVDFYTKLLASNK
jgi:hypothetical protein